MARTKRTPRIRHRGVTIHANVQTHGHVPPSRRTRTPLTSKSILTPSLAPPSLPLASSVSESAATASDMPPRPPAPAPAPIPPSISFSPLTVESMIQWLQSIRPYFQCSTCFGDLDDAHIHIAPESPDCLHRFCGKCAVISKRNGRVSAPHPDRQYDELSKQYRIIIEAVQIHIAKAKSQNKVPAVEINSTRTTATKLNKVGEVEVEVEVANHPKTLKSYPTNEEEVMTNRPSRQTGSPKKHRNTSTNIPPPQSQSTPTLPTPAHSLKRELARQSTRERKKLKSRIQQMNNKQHESLTLQPHSHSNANSTHINLPLATSTSLSSPSSDNDGYWYDSDDDDVPIAKLASKFKHKQRRRNTKKDRTTKMKRNGPFGRHEYTYEDKDRSNIKKKVVGVEKERIMNMVIEEEETQEEKNENNDKREEIVEKERGGLSFLLQKEKGTETTHSKSNSNPVTYYSGGGSSSNPDPTIDSDSEGDNDPIVQFTSRERSRRVGYGTDGSGGHSDEGSLSDDDSMYGYGNRGHDVKVMKKHAMYDDAAPNPEDEEQIVEGNGNAKLFHHDDDDNIHDVLEEEKEETKAKSNRDNDAATAAAKDKEEAKAASICENDTTAKDKEETDAASNHENDVAAAIAALAKEKEDAMTESSRDNDDAPAPEDEHDEEQTDSHRDNDHAASPTNDKEEAKVQSNGDNDDTVAPEKENEEEQADSNRDNDGDNDAAAPTNDEEEANAEYNRDNDDVTAAGNDNEKAKAQSNCDNDASEKQKEDMKAESNRDNDDDVVAAALEEENEEEQAESNRENDDDDDASPEKEKEETNADSNRDNDHAAAPKERTEDGNNDDDAAAPEEQKEDGNEELLYYNDDDEMDISESDEEEMEEEYNNHGIDDDDEMDISECDNEEMEKDYKDHSEANSDNLVLDPKPDSGPMLVCENDILGQRRLLGKERDNEFKADNDVMDLNLTSDPDPIPCHEDDVLRQDMTRKELGTEDEAEVQSVIVIDIEADTETKGSQEKCINSLDGELSKGSSNEHPNANTNANELGSRNKAIRIVSVNEKEVTPSTDQGDRQFAGAKEPCEEADNDGQQPRKQHRNLTHPSERNRSIVTDKCSGIDEKGVKKLGSNDVKMSQSNVFVPGDTASNNTTKKSAATSIAKITVSDCTQFNNNNDKKEDGESCRDPTTSSAPLEHKSQTKCPHVEVKQKIPPIGSSPDNCSAQYAVTEGKCNDVTRSSMNEHDSGSCNSKRENNNTATSRCNKKQRTSNTSLTNTKKNGDDNRTGTEKEQPKSILTSSSSLEPDLEDSNLPENEHSTRSDGGDTDGSENWSSPSEQDSEEDSSDNESGEESESSFELEDQMEEDEEDSDIYLSDASDRINVGRRRHSSRRKSTRLRSRNRSLSHTRTRSRTRRSVRDQGKYRSKVDDETDAHSATSNESDKVSVGRRRRASRRKSTRRHSRNASRKDARRRVQDQGQDTCKDTHSTTSNESDIDNTSLPSHVLFSARHTEGVEVKRADDTVSSKRAAAKNASKSMTQNQIENTPSPITQEQMSPYVRWSTRKRKKPEGVEMKRADDSISSKRAAAKNASESMTQNQIENAPSPTQEEQVSPYVRWSTRKRKKPEVYGGANLLSSNEIDSIITRHDYEWWSAKYDDSNNNMYLT